MHRLWRLPGRRSPPQTRYRTAVVWTLARAERHRGFIVVGICDANVYHSGPDFGTWRKVELGAFVDDSW